MAFSFMNCVRLLLLCIYWSHFVADACTSFAIGKKATADGSVIVSQSEDGDDLADDRVIWVPAADHHPHAMAPSYYTDGPFPRWTTRAMGQGYRPNRLTGRHQTKPIGYIPQVRHTYGFWASNFGILNEHNVGIAETTCSAMFYTCAKGDTRHCEPGRTTGEALLDIRMLTYFGLQRARTAREAIRVMGDLAFKYGFYGTHDANGDGESLMVGDKDEAWVFHILADPNGTSAIWAARRVPDDSMVVAANMYVIRDCNVTDADNCMASANMYSIAEERGWWQRGKPFDFTKIYSNGEYGQKFYSGRRHWRAKNLAAPSLRLNPNYSDLRYDRTWPLFVKPDKLLTKENIFSWYRDWYAGTDFDMTKGLAAGYGGTPDRYDTPHGPNIHGHWERSIALYRTNLIKVVQLQQQTRHRPKGLAGVCWAAPGPGHYAPFLPLPSGLHRQVKTVLDVSPFKFERDAFNWEVRKVMAVAQIRFDYMHPLVEKKQHEAEAAGSVLLSHMKEEWREKVQRHIRHTLDAWKSLSSDMVLHFADNSDMSKIAAAPAIGDEKFGKTENTASLGYPDWWLKAVGFEQGPPPPPVEEQCPPMCGPAASELIGADSPRNQSIMFVGVGSALMASLITATVFAWRRSKQGQGDAPAYMMLA